MYKIACLILLLSFSIAGCARQVNVLPEQRNETPVVNTTNSTINVNVTVDESNTSASSAAGANSSSKVITILAHNFAFDQSGPKIHKGDIVTINFVVAQGTHSFLSEGLDVAIPPTSQGQTRSVTFIADKIGNFSYRCNNPCGPGHLGMLGSIEVLP